ncbi:hypothetical protein LY78DRAFT_686493 [Colletotrichum sublineola]|nr:hypothetical protein LY78DRAFT_686493 [Colletotrichum sublineola]
MAKWLRSYPQSIQQVGSNDYGVRVILYVFHALAGVAAPPSTDWTLWRRIIAAFLWVQGRYQSKPGIESILDNVRKAHDELLSAGTATVRTHASLELNINQLVSGLEPSRITVGNETCTRTDLKTSQQLDTYLGEWHHAVQVANAQAKRHQEACFRSVKSTEKSIRLIIQALHAGSWRLKKVVDSCAARDNRTANIKCLKQSADNIRHQGNNESTVRFLEGKIRVLGEEQRLAAARYQAGEEAWMASEEGLNAIAAELDLMLEACYQND